MRDSTTRNGAAQCIQSRPSWSSARALLSRFGALGQELRLGSEFQVNSYTRAVQGYPDVGGGATATSSWSGSEARTDARRLRPALRVRRGPLGMEFQVNTYTGLQALPAMAAIGDRGLRRRLESYRQTAPATASSPGASRAPAWRSARVPGQHVHLSASARTAIATDAERRLRRGLGEHSPGRAGAGVFARRRSTPRRPLGDEFQVNSYNRRSAQSCDHVDAGGDFVVVWQSSPGWSGYGIFAQRFAAPGAPLGSSSWSTPSPPASSPARRGAGRYGDFVVAWQSNDQDGRATASSRGATRAPAPRSPPSSRSTSIHHFDQTTGGRHAADGDFVIAWESNFRTSTATACSRAASSTAGSP